MIHVRAERKTLPFLNYITNVTHFEDPVFNLKVFTITGLLLLLIYDRSSRAEELHASPLKNLLKTAKIKLFLCLIKHRAMKTYGRLEVWLHAFLILALD